MINKTVESGRSRVGQCGQPPPNISETFRAAPTVAFDRFQFGQFYFNNPSGNYNYYCTKSLTNVSHVPENKKFQPKRKLYFIFVTDTLTTSSFCLHFFSCRAVYVCRHSSMNNYRKSLVPVSGETRAFSILRKASRNPHSWRKAELRFRALVTRYRSVAWHPRGTFFAESASLKGFLVKWKRLRRGNEDDQRRIPWPVYRGGRT